MSEEPGIFGPDTYIRALGCTIHVRTADMSAQAESWKRYFLDLGHRVKNLRPVFESFGQYMVTGSIMRNFEAEGRPDRWAPLSPKYKAWKENHYPGRPILVLTGEMKAGFQYEATELTLKIRNVKWYWKVHQTGYGPNNLPARVMLLLQDADKSVLTRKTRQYIKTGEV